VATDTYFWERMLSLVREDENEDYENTYISELSLLWNLSQNASIWYYTNIRRKRRYPVSHRY